MSEFTEAIQRGDVAAVAALIDSDPSLLQSSDKGVTPILLAIYHGKKDVARLLVDRGAPVTFFDAVALGDADRALRMLDDDPHLIYAKSADGYPGVGLAIFFGHPALAQELIRRGADVNAVADNANCVAPVHAAAAACDRETMQLLLERGADPNTKQQMDYTALHGAASRGDIEMAKLLLAHGADRNARGTDGLTAADVARKHGKPEFAQWWESM